MQRATSVLALLSAMACSSSHSTPGGTAGPSSGGSFGSAGSGSGGGGSSAGSAGNPVGGAAGTAGATTAGGASGTTSTAAGAGGEDADPSGPVQTALRHFRTGRQITLFDVDGNQVDAHDGHIQFFGGRYWLYGTSYDCGFEWQAPGAPFCGFKSYSSSDLAHWHDEGFLFDASTAEWQKRCDGSSYGCYRPKVIFNEASGSYVLWVNVYDNSSGFRVFTGASPSGPFELLPEPVVSANQQFQNGLNDGDHALFVDDDGTAFISYTDWRAGGAIAIEQLNADYTSRAGAATFAAKITPGSTEAPALFKRGGTYYLTYSDPNCGYCGSADGSSKLNGTGTGYRTAPHPLGPWSEGKSISPASCGGQPSFVSAIALAGGETAYLYGSDLWRGGAKNEALANFFWAPLTFAADGSLAELDCRDTVELELALGKADDYAEPAHLDATSGNEDFSFFCDIAGNIARAQSFVVGRDGTLTTLSITTFKRGALDAPLVVSVFVADAQGKPQGGALASQAIPASELGYSARRLDLDLDLAVTAGERLVVTLGSTTSAGCYGIEYSDEEPYAAGSELYSNDAGASFSPEAKRALKFFSVVEP